MKDFILEGHTKVVFGRGCVKEYLASFVEEHGPNVLLAYGGGSVKRSGLYDEVFRILRRAGKQVVDLPDIPPGPTYEKALEGAGLVRENGIDLILAVGGGSVLDCCKAVSLAAVCRGDLWADLWDRRGVVDLSPVPLGAIVTTFGAGGSMNGRAVLANEALHVKYGRDHPKCVPVFALMDPAHTLSLPWAQTVSGGLDAFCRLMEGYFSYPEEEDLSDDLAEPLMRGMLRALRALMRDPGSYEARGDLMWGSALSGSPLIALGKRMDLPFHRLARLLEEATGRPYTHCLAVLLPACYRRTCERRAARSARFARQVWEIAPEGRTEAELARAGAEALARFFKALGLPASLEGVAGAALERLKACAAACPFPPQCGFPLEPGELPEVFQACCTASPGLSGTGAPQIST